MFDNVYLTIYQKNMNMASHKYWEQLLFFKFFRVVVGYNLEVEGLL